MTVSTGVRVPAPRTAPRVVVCGAWTVALSATSGVETRVDQVGGVMLVSVRDADTSEGTTVVLHADGTVTVRAGATPPALLVSPTSARTLPAVPGVSETVRFDTAQRLLVLSSDALDALPESLAQVLQALPERVIGREPADLLTQLFADLPGGSGVIVARRPVPGVAGPDHEEARWASAQRS